MHPLEKYREIQNKHGPNWCFFAAKFFAGKITGLFHPARHTQDFINSSWYKKHKERTKVFYSWAKPFKANRKYFNDHVIRPAILLPQAGLAKIPPTKKVAQFEMFRSTSKAQSLLGHNIPVVAAVDLKHANTGGWGGQDHYVTIVRGASKGVWIVDPWGVASRFSIVKHPTGSLLKKVTVDMNAGMTTLPPNRPFYGYFCDVGGPGYKRTL